MTAEERSASRESATSDEPAVEQPFATYCAKHPRVETYLRCGRCETPICPKCLIMTPVGARCRDCARLRKLPIFEVRPIHDLRGLGAGLGAATLGAIALAFLPGLGFFGLLIVAALGYGVGEATTAAANRKRGTGLAIVAALALPAGMILGRMLVLLVFAGGGDVVAALVVATWGLLSVPWGILLLLVAMAIAFSRVR